MPTITISKHQSAYLERTARRMSGLKGAKVTKRDVINAILDTAIEDEGLYDPQTSEPVDAYRKRVCQAEKEARTSSFDTEALIRQLQPGIP